VTTVEYRRTFTAGQGAGHWETLPPEIAEVVPTHGAGSLGDIRNDVGQFLERRANGGDWETFSYWRGAADFATRARLEVIARMENDHRHLAEKGQRLIDNASAEVQGARDAISAGEQRLTDALAKEKADKDTARDLHRQAKMTSDQIAILRREREHAEEPVTA
jgi:hypothetical protein